MKTLIFDYCSNRYFFFSVTSLIYYFVQKCLYIVSVVTGVIIKHLQARKFTFPDHKLYFIPVCSLIQVDLIFILDSSTSMGRSDFQNMKDFVKNVISQIDITNGSSRVGVFTFSNDAKLEFGLKTYNTNEDIIKAIDAIPQYFGNTNTAAALRAVTRQGFTKTGGDRENIPNVAVLITDGIANVDIDQTLPESKIVKSEGIYLYAFAIKLRAHSDFRKIASLPSNRTAVFLPNFKSLVSYSPSFMQTLCEGNSIY